MPYESIAKENGYDEDSYTYYPVLIVGAGESGIALGCRLKEKLGFDQFRIFDRQAGIGGTWWINRYPGVACDVPAFFYSFSFSPNNRWTSFHPPGPEIVKYLEDVCEKYKIVDKIQLNTDVSEARWLEEEGLWEVTLQHVRPGLGDWGAKDRQNYIDEHGADQVYLKKEIVRAKILASAVGGLVEPKAWPNEIPGRDKFQGDIFHSARWNYDVDLSGKDVVVVGTGCSAAQFVPRLTKAPHNAKSVTQLMRSPPWVVPRPQPPGGPEQWARWSPALLSNIPGLALLLRFGLFLVSEYDWRLFGDEEHNRKARAKLEVELLDHMKENVPEKYHEMLTPDYDVCCKRRIFDATWFPGLNDPRIELTTLPLTSVDERSVTLGPGRTYPDQSKAGSKVPTEQVKKPADAIILANGFDVSEWLHPLRIRGRGGKLLHDVWRERGGAQAYLGTAMDGFPNMFIIFGPNTATGHSSVILATENMIEYGLKFMGPILKGDVAQVEVKREAEMSWTKKIQEKSQHTVYMMGGCRNWYKDANNWNSTVYPWSQTNFMFKCMFPRYRDWDFKYTAKGILKQKVRRGLMFLCVTLAIVGVFRARQAGSGVLEMPGVLRMYTKQFLAGVLSQGVQGLQYLRAQLA
ncbi:MAG: hypothetical protein M1817_006859 [Caeruleum heppii]|nr:MAG: hypothetical protein M1817_006859 [Caeruleum heppii]